MDRWIDGYWLGFNSTFFNSHVNSTDNRIAAANKKKIFNN